MPVANLGRYKEFFIPCLKGNQSLKERFEYYSRRITSLGEFFRTHDMLYLEVDKIMEKMEELILILGEDSSKAYLTEVLTYYVGFYFLMVIERVAFNMLIREHTPEGFGGGKSRLVEEEVKRLDRLVKDCLENPQFREKVNSYFVMNVYDEREDKVHLDKDELRHRCVRYLRNYRHISRILDLKRYSPLEWEKETARRWKFIRITEGVAHLFKTCLGPGKREEFLEAIENLRKINHLREYEDQDRKARSLAIQEKLFGKRRIFNLVLGIQIEEPRDLCPGRIREFLGLGNP